MPGFLPSGGEEFDLGSVTRLIAQSFRAFVFLFKCKRDRENF